MDIVKTISLTYKKRDLSDQSNNVDEPKKQEKLVLIIQMARVRSNIFLTVFKMVKTKEIN